MCKGARAQLAVWDSEGLQGMQVIQVLQARWVSLVAPAPEVKRVILAQMVYLLPLAQTDPLASRVHAA